MQLLFTVEDRFQIEGRGCVLVPGLSAERDSPRVTKDARIRLQTPDGKEVDTFIVAIERIRYREKPEKIHFPILLPNDFTKEDVPVGTKVFLSEGVR